MEHKIDWYTTKTTYIQREEIERLEMYLEIETSFETFTTNKTY